MRTLLTLRWYSGNFLRQEMTMPTQSKHLHRVQLEQQHPVDDLPLPSLPTIENLVSLRRPVKLPNPLQLPKLLHALQLVHQPAPSKKQRPNWMISTTTTTLS
jgi:hypothetical protein